MRFNDLFPSKYLKADDVLTPRVFAIADIFKEEIGEDRKEKPILSFQNEPRVLVLNKTNGNMIKNSYGEDVNSWIGKRVELHSEPVSFQGRVVNAIRIRIPAPPQGPPASAETVAASQSPTAPVPAAEYDADEIDV